MITDEEIEEKAELFGIPPSHVEKDYVHSWVLWGINQRPKLKQLLVLKGGNALRKGYFPETRFSKDLDFSSTINIDQKFLQNELNEICKLVQSKTNVKFLDETIIKDKNLPIPNIEALEARLYFKGFYNEENLTLKTQLDVTQFDQIILPVQEVKILHPYSDSHDCNAMIRCQKAEEILASKLTTLLHRRKAGDIFDLLYSILIGTSFEVSRREVITTFLKKSIFEPRPEEVKNELLSVPLSEYQATWGNLLVPTTSVIAFDYVMENFSDLINSLFESVSERVRDIFSSTQRVGRTLGTPIVDFSYCPSDIRSKILSAGRSLRMIEMVYDGYSRLIEPYKFEYYVRKKDGVGNEYFWGWDNSGGRSGKIGIKMFFCDKIRNVSLTDRTYSPKYAVEM